MHLQSSTEQFPLFAAQTPEDLREDWPWGIWFTSPVGISNSIMQLILFPGDIHQPLHATTMYTPSLPGGDLGGNKFYLNIIHFFFLYLSWLLQHLTTPGYNKLHGFWDSGVGMLNNSIVRPLSADAAEYLSTTVSNFSYISFSSRLIFFIQADQIMAFSADITANASWTNVTQWGMESYYYAIEYCYNITNNTTPSQECIHSLCCF